jgi:hypothetical protein
MWKASKCTIEQTLILKNPYISLEFDNNIIRNYVKTNTVSETKISDIDSNQKYNKHNLPVRYCRSTKKPTEEPKKED